MMTILPMFEQSGTARTLWSPLLFRTTGKEHIISKDGITGTVMLNGLQMTLSRLKKMIITFTWRCYTHQKTKFSFEEPELTADDDLIEREDETDVQHSRPERSRRMAATAGDFLFY